MMGNLEMTIQNMFGVVLWSDTNAQKAVIWCEDQGELAFYTPSDRSVHNAPSLDAGDLVKFDVTVQKNMRKATNPQLLQQSHSPNLQTSLRSSRTKPDVENISKKVVDIARYFNTPGPQCIAQSG
jgi:hypothetical protein